MTASSRLTCVGLALVASLLACARPTPPPPPPPPPPPAESPPPSAEGEPCVTSLVRNVDGTPSVIRACAPGLICDDLDAPPDGAGRCAKPR